MTPIWLPPGVVEGPAYGTDHWMKHRRGLVTASRFGDVMTEPRSVPRPFITKYADLVPAAERFKELKSGPRAGQQVEVENIGKLVAEAAEAQGIYCWGDTAKSYLMELVASTITEHDRVGGKSAAMERGVDKESDAIDRYQDTKFVDVAQGRLLLRTDCLIGATPDGFIEEDEEGPGLLEIKCPESKRHLETWLSRTLPEEYHEQVHGQMWVADRAWCDFVSFDDRFPRPMQLVIIRVYADEAYRERLKARVTAFAGEVDARIREIRSFLAEASPEQADTVMDALNDELQTQEQP